MNMQAADELQAALDKIAMANRSRRAADPSGCPVDGPLESELADHLSIAAALHAYRPEPSAAFLRRSQQAILGLGTRPRRGRLTEFLSGFTSAPSGRRSRIRLAALPFALALMLAMVPFISLAAPGSPLYGLRQASGRVLTAVQDGFGQSLAALFGWDRPPADVGKDGSATPEPRASEDTDALIAHADGSAARPGTDSDTTAPTWDIVTQETIAPSRRRTPTASSLVAAAQSASPTTTRQSPTQGSISGVPAVTDVPAASEVPSATVASATVAAATRQPTVAASAGPTDRSGPSATTTMVPTLPPTRTPPPAGATASSTTAPTPTDDPGLCPSADRRVTGRLTGPDGQPVAGAQVLIADPSGENHQGSADGVGAFSISGLCPGYFQAMAFLEHPGGMLLGFYDPDGDGQPDWLDLTALREPPGGIDILLSAVETPTPAP